MAISLDQLFMKLDELKTLFPGKINFDNPSLYDVKTKWFSTDEAQIPNAIENGVYIYTSIENEVLYIGKGEYSSGGGIGYRSCSHLGRAVRDADEMFPNHQWTADKDVKDSIKNCITKGNFYIWTLPIKPAHFISLVEVYLQTAYHDHYTNLPPLNKKIG